jgi:hypothetical protein
MEDNIVAKWRDLRALVEALEVDVAKSARGVGAAGVRARKGLRMLKTVAADLVKMTFESDKAKKEGT